MIDQHRRKRATRGRTRSEIDVVLEAGGEVGGLMRDFDWSSTPLGPMQTWEQSLWSALSICLSSRFPIVMYWGPDLTVLYNDAYARILGAKHPWALGKPCAVCWAEIWDTIGPMLRRVVESGEATWSDDLELLLERNGAPEECYFSFSFSPVRVESGDVGGVFTAVVETTQRVLSDRRLRLLTRVGEHSARARSREDACARCVEALQLSDPRPVPFALFYLFDDDHNAHLAATKGLAGGRGIVSRVSLGDSGSRWPIDDVIATGRPAPVELDPADWDAAEPWAHETPPKQAVVLPIGFVQSGQMDGFVVAATNPVRPLDGDYQAFFDLMAKQVSAAVADGKAYEEQERKAEALAELDRAKTEFFSNVSHEFRTPLTLLLGPLEALSAQVSPGSPQAQQVELARRNALRLLKLVNTLLDFSRIDSIRREASPEPIDLAAYTADLAGVFRSAIEMAGLRLVVDCQPLERPVNVDREMWEKVVFNLLSNALKFTTSGEITVRVGAIDGQAELLVADTGVGISERDLAHVFDRFYRVREPAARTQEGAGIGLALVKELVAMMSGEISVSSTPGRGTAFTVRIPFGAGSVEGEAQRTALQREGQVASSTYVAEAVGWLQPAISGGRSTGSQTSPTTERKRILLADDNADMRAYVEQLLSERWEVEAVADGRQALEAARRRLPDLVLTDVMMPLIDGFQLVAALRSDIATRDVPIIIVTARGGEDASIEGFARGADDYLVKPFTHLELVARVDANIRLDGMRKELARARTQAQLVTERGAFLNVAAHELRTPLTVVGGYMDLLLNGTLEWDSGAGRVAIQTAAFKTQEALRILDQMLLAARLESEKIGLRARTVDLRDIVQETVHRSLAIAKFDSKTVTVALPEAPVMVAADEALVGLILDNLIGNALFHRGGDDILVEVVPDVPGVRVIDTGPRIDEEARSKIFEAFFKAEANLSWRGEAGLRLAVGRRLAELHGGSLILEDTPKGTSFLLTLPAADFRVASGLLPSTIAEPPPA